ncbi:MAG: IS110 family transposase [Sedimentisphaerales bacterium]|nr:IS110 family transposase [Sedimentisphaerales bacterium]
MNKYIGLDIDDKKIVACAVVAGMEDTYATIPFCLDELRKYLISQKKGNFKVHAAFEISGMAGFIYDQIVDSVTELQVVNPSKATWIYRTNKKNDKIDARKMAILYQIGELPTVYMPSKDVRNWRRLILHRQKTVNKITRTKNQIRALLKSQGYFKPVQSCGFWTKKSRLWMQELAAGQRDFDIFSRVQLDNLLNELEMLEKNRDGVTEVLDEILVNNSGAELMLSIPGIGPRTAEAVLAYTDKIDRFSNGKKYCAYFGLTPRLDESGSMRRLGHISKTGPAVVRWALCEASWRAIRYSPALRRFYERIVGGMAGRKKIAIIAVARKLLMIMRAMLKTGETFNEKYLSEQLEVAA